MLKRYLLWFAHDHGPIQIQPFRNAELASLIKLLGVKLNVVTDLEDKKPFMIVEATNDEELKKVVSRSFTMRYAIELWAHGKTEPEFQQNLKTFYKNHDYDDTQTFKINVESFNNHIPQVEKVKKIDSLKFMDFKGKVDLKQPQNEFYYIEYFGHERSVVTEKPLDYIFGRWIVNGNRSVVKELSLKTRYFIGNTTMDPFLALLMANQGLVKKHDFVFDPFVGSGGILCACAKFGAYVMGTDIDFLMLHGRTKPSRKYCKERKSDESILANLKQYNCEKLYVDALVADFSAEIWSDKLEFDSIICDPPYGVRESNAKVEKKQARKPEAFISEEHYPSTSKYQLSQLYKDLVKFSAKHLKIGGRLVFWLPVYREDYSESQLPRHKSLEIVSNCEQILTTVTSRRLLTYEKVSKYVEDAMDNEEDENSGLDNFRQKWFTHVLEKRSKKDEDEVAKRKAANSS
ncbi:tRNA (guanine(10)-N2)-methyltransferase homolog [Culicoides brevitarsis]|uniref:tRNA (guanine(10)-N2)-methyltransferase homolog n=1 Tax=Culicoides brevitarsis TaxID=469753 RepID=UPI00307B4050